MLVPRMIVLGDLYRFLWSAKKKILLPQNGPFCRILFSKCRIPILSSAKRAVLQNFILQNFFYFAEFCKTRFVLQNSAKFCKMKKHSAKRAVLQNLYFAEAEFLSYRQIFRKTARFAEFIYCMIKSLQATIIV